MTDISAGSSPARPSGHGVTLAQAIRVWLRIGLLSFGGPAGQIAMMHRVLVEELRWIGETRFLHALTSALSAITAAVVGVILNLAIWFALHTLFREVREVRIAGMSADWPVPASIDIPALLLTVAAVVAVFRFRVGVLPVIGGCAAAGLLLHVIT